MQLQGDPIAAMGPEPVRRPRRASDLRGVFRDREALEGLIHGGDPVIYETHEPAVPEAPGHLMFGLTVLHAGRVGDEYFMTRGHYHVRRQTAEVYLCLRGRGSLLMQMEHREAHAVPLAPGSVVYVPPGWAHRSVNTGDEPLVLFFAFPADAGHDYEAIAREGFGLRVVQAGGKPAVIRAGTLQDSPHSARSGR